MCSVLEPWLKFSYVNAFCVICIHIVINVLLGWCIRMLHFLFPLRCCLLQCNFLTSLYADYWIILGLWAIWNITLCLGIKCFQFIWACWYPWFILRTIVIRCHSSWILHWSMHDIGPSTSMLLMEVRMHTYSTAHVQYSLCTSHDACFTMDLRVWWGLGREDVWSLPLQTAVIVFLLPRRRHFTSTYFTIPYQILEVRLNNLIWIHLSWSCLDSGLSYLGHLA